MKPIRMRKNEELGSFKSSFLVNGHKHKVLIFISHSFLVKNELSQEGKL
jgi:hypothetical protein